MNKLISAVLFGIGFCGHASADDRYVLNGLYCNTESQIEEAIGYIRRDVPPEAAVALTNRETVVCVYADKIRYMLERPVIIGATHHRGLPLVKYEATLIGVLVGGNTRPIEPPLKMFFVLTERLPGVAMASGA